MFFMTLNYLLIWEEDYPLPETFLKEYPSPTKAKNTYLSRKALAGLLSKKYNQDFPLDSPIDLEKLKILNHHNLLNFSDTLVSISHTKKVAAALIADIKKYQSVGIDIEFLSRKMNPKIQKFFRHNEDQEENSLKLWSKKEAAFKALHPLWKEEKTFVLKDIWVKGNDFGLLIDKNIRGHFQIDIIKNDLYVCVAIILR